MPTCARKDACALPRRIRRRFKLGAVFACQECGALWQAVNIGFTFDAWRWRKIGQIRG